MDEKTQEILRQKERLEKQRTAILNVLEDIAEEKEKVAHERDKINAILYSIGDGVFVIDKDWKITMFNNIAEQISGYSAEEAIGQRYDEVIKFVLEKTGEKNDKFIRDCIKTGTITQLSNHTVLIKKDGEKVPVSDSAAPLKDLSGEIIGCVIAFRDITKEYEIDKAKTEFVSLASHQLRTPLTAISWYTEMLLAGDAGAISSNQKKYLQEVYGGNKRMIDLVNSLLNVSRLELGTFLIEPEVTNLEEIVDSVIKEEEHRIKEKKIDFCKEYDQTIPKIKVDPKLIRMVFQNLLSNAVKYTPDEGKVSLTVKKKEPDVFIKVADTGYGIPKKQQSKIFSKLFRADNVMAKDTEGTGLGLYVVKSIVESSEGKIWFESEEDKGSTFFVSLPLAGMKEKKGTKELS